MSFRASGLRAWIWQRAGAIIIAVFVLFAVGFYFFGDIRNYRDWYQAITSLPLKIFIGLSFGGLLIHSWVGVRDVFIDYVHHPGVRHTLLFLLALWLAAQALWILFILVSVNG